MSQKRTFVCAHTEKMAGDFPALWTVTSEVAVAPATTSTCAVLRLTSIVPAASAHSLAERSRIAETSLRFSACVSQSAVRRVGEGSTLGGQYIRRG